VPPGLLTVASVEERPIYRRAMPRSFVLLPKQPSCARLKMAYRYGSISMIDTTAWFNTACDGWALPFGPGLSSPGRSDHREPEGVVAEAQGAVPACAGSAAAAGSGVWHSH
jgi:hypothetical protein